MIKIFRIPEAQARPVAAGVRRLLRAQPRATRAAQGIHANCVQAQLHPAAGMPFNSEGDEISFDCMTETRLR